MKNDLRKETQPEYRDVFVTFTLRARVEHRPPPSAYKDGVDIEQRMEDQAADSIYVGSGEAVGAVELNGQMVMSSNEKNLQELTRHCIEKAYQDAPEVLGEMISPHIAMAAMGRTNAEPLTAPVGKPPIPSSCT